MKKLITCIAAAVSTFGISHAATVVFDAAEDTYVRGGANRWTNFGDATEMVTKEDDNWNFRRRGLVKFEVGDSTPLHGVELLLTQLRSKSGSIDIYGISDDWSEDTASYEGIKDVITFKNGAYLGSMELGSKGTLSFTSEALMNFVKSDENGLVSFMIVSDGAPFGTIEGGDAAELVYENPIPMGAALFVPGLAMLAIARRRRQL